MEVNFNTPMKLKLRNFTDSELSILNEYELSKAVFDVTSTETRDAWKGLTKLPDNFLDTFGGIEHILHNILRKFSSHPTIIKIYHDELERLNKGLVSTKGILVTLRGMVGVPTRGSDRNNLSSEIRDLRDMAHGLEESSSDLVKRVEKLDRNLSSQDSLTDDISRVEVLEIKGQKYPEERNSCGFRRY